MKKIAKTIVIVVFILIGLYFWLVFPLAWETQSHKKSPDGEIIAYHLRSTSESGQAPYGNHIVLTRNYWPFGQYFGDTVFAAYAIGEVKYRWLTNHLLLIECETEKIVKQIEKVNHIHIQYNLIRPNHNKGADT